MKFKLIILTAFFALLVGCLSTPLKAPCDEYGSTCGTKTKINRW